MQKIGILTYHNNRNYGAAMQAYALAACLQRLGHHAEVIDYTENVHYLRERKLYNKLPLGPLRYLKSIPFRRFCASEIPLSSRSYRDLSAATDLDKEYSHLVFGSDQIWSLPSKGKGHDLTFFGHRLKFEGSKVAYAPSAGQTTEYSPAYAPAIRDCLSDFQHLSVRDSNTRQLIEPLVGKTIEKVLDPTFLVDYDKFMGDASPISQPYLLLYGRFDERQAEELIMPMIRKYKCKVISVGHWCKLADKNLLLANPRDWVKYFRHASYVATGYYHGMLFGFHFEKPTLVIGSHARKAKILDMLQDFGLESLWLPEGSCVDDNVIDHVESIDWSVFRVKRNELVSKSTDYLERALR